MAFARGGFKFMKKNRSRLEAKTIIDKKINKRRSTKASDKENIKKEDKTKRGDKGRKESINNEKVKKTLNDKNAEKDLTKAKGEGSENKNKNAHKSNYPCCFYIPLDIAMEGLALFDIIYFSCVTITWTVILALEPFAGTNYMSARRNKTVGPQFLDSMMRLFDFQLSATPPPDVGFEYEDRFEETSTTLGPLPYDPVDVDEEKMARTFSRIAYLYSENAQEVDENCGENYFVDYLFTHELAVTRDLFEEIAIIITCASILYVFLGGLLMATICCFRGYIFSKIFVILLWYSQLVPSYLTVNGAYMSQSHRLCIIEYGLSRRVRGQTLLFWLLLWPVIILKPYQIFIWSTYIYEYFNNKQCKLLDESYYSALKVEERHKHAPLYAAIDQERDQRTLTRPHLFRQTKKIILPKRKGKSKRLLWGGSSSKFRKEFRNSSSSD